MRRSFLELPETHVREALKEGVLKQGDFMARLAARLNRSPKSMFHPSHLGRNKKVLDRMMKEKKLYRRQVGSKVVWSLTLMAIDRFEADHYASETVAQKSQNSAAVSIRVRDKAPAPKSGNESLEERISLLEAKIRSLEAWKRYVTATLFEKRKALIKMVEEGEAIGRQVVP